MSREDLKILIQQGDIDGVDEFIRKGGDVNGIFENGKSPLELAIECSNRAEGSDRYVIVDEEPISHNDEIIIQLISAGAEVNVDSGDSPLHRALDRRVHCKVIYSLINAGSDVNAEDKSNWETPLMYAIIRNYNGLLISYLIEKGADVNHTACYGETPLQYAFKHIFCFEITSMLLNEGVIVNELSDSGRNMLLYSLSHLCSGSCKNRRLVDLVVKNGLDLKAVDDIGRSSIFYTFCSYFINECIKSGLSINSKDVDGDTPLMCTVHNNCTEEAKILLFRFGADPNCGNNRLFTPLHEVVYNGIDTICELLLYCGADLFAEDVDNRTPLDYVNTNKVIYITIEDFYPYNAVRAVPYELRQKRFGIIKHILLFYSEICLNDQFINYSHGDQEILNKFIGDCGDELTKMKNTLLTNDLSFYEFCKKKRFYKSKVINISKDEYKFTRDEIKEMFPLYNYLINLRIEDNRTKKCKRDLVSMFENIIIRPQVANENEFNEVTLLYDCMYDVATHLDHSELYNVFLASINHLT